MNRWSRRRHRRWVAIVLPGLLLRALIPVGFMPMFGPGFQVQLALCEGYAPIASTAMDMSKDMPMDMSMGAPDPGGLDPHSHQDHSACPFGASPALAALPALTDVPIALQSSAQSLISTPQVANFEIVARAQTPRGPPPRSLTPSRSVV